MRDFGACAMTGCSVQLDGTSGIAVRCLSAVQGQVQAWDLSGPIPPPPRGRKPPNQAAASLEPEPVDPLQTSAKPTAHISTWQAEASRKNCGWSCLKPENSEMREVACGLRARRLR